MIYCGDIAVFQKVWHTDGSGYRVAPQLKRADSSVVLLAQCGSKLTLNVGSKGCKLYKRVR